MCLTFMCIHTTVYRMGLGEDWLVTGFVPVPVWLDVCVFFTFFLPVDIQHVANNGLNISAFTSGRRLQNLRFLTLRGYV